MLISANFFCNCFFVDGSMYFTAGSTEAGNHEECGEVCGKRWPLAHSAGQVSISQWRSTNHEYV